MEIIRAIKNLAATVKASLADGKIDSREWAEIAASALAIVLVVLGNDASPANAKLAAAIDDWSKESGCDVTC